MSLMPIKAHAWGSAKDERIQPPAKTEIVAEAVPSPSIGEVKSTVNKLLVSSQKKIETAIGKKDSETARSINAINAAVATAKNEIVASQTASATAVTTAVDTAKSEIMTGQATVKDATSRNTSILIVSILLIIVSIGSVVALVVYVKKGTDATKDVAADVQWAVNTIREEVLKVPRITAALVKKLDPMVIDLTDVAGHHVIYTPPIVDGMYVTLHVPSSVSSPAPNLNQIIRTGTTDKSSVRRSTRGILAEYFKNIEPGTPAPTTEQGIQQIALITHLLKLSYGQTTGELMEIEAV